MFIVYIHGSFPIASDESIRKKVKTNTICGWFSIRNTLHVFYMAMPAPCFQQYRSDYPSSLGGYLLQPVRSYARYHQRKGLHYSAGADFHVIFRCPGCVKLPSPRGKEKPAINGWDFPCNQVSFSKSILVIVQHFGWQALLLFAQLSESALEEKESESASKSEVNLVQEREVKTPADFAACQAKLAMQAMEELPRKLNAQMDSKKMPQQEAEDQPHQEVQPKKKSKAKKRKSKSSASASMVLEKSSRKDQDRAECHSQVAMVSVRQIGSRCANGAAPKIVTGL